MEHVTVYLAQLTGRLIVKGNKYSCTWPMGFFWWRASVFMAQ